MSGTYIDAGWTGTPAALTAALAALGFQINADNSITIIEGALNVDNLTLTQYRVLDGVAYVLVRSTSAVPLPAGIAAVGPDLIRTISGVFMSDGTEAPTSITPASFFQLFTPAELAALWPAATASTAISAGLILYQSATSIDLTSTGLGAWLDNLVSAGVLTPARRAVINPLVAPTATINEADQLAARTEYRARALEAQGKLLEAYALRNNLTAKIGN